MSGLIVTRVHSDCASNPGDATSASGKSALTSSRSKASFTKVINGPLIQVKKPMMKNSRPMMAMELVWRVAGAAVMAVTPLWTIAGLAPVVRRRR